MTDSMHALEGFLFEQTGKSGVQLKAWEYLNETGLPGKKSESYKFSPIVATIKKHINWTAKESIEKVFSESFYNIEGNHLVFINGQLSKEHSIIKDIEVEQSEVTTGKHDPFSLLNTAFAKEEIHIHSKREKAQVFIYHFNGEAFTNSRVKVKVGVNQQIEVVQKVLSSDNIKTFTNTYIEFEVGKNGIAYHTKVQDYSSNTYSHESTFAHVGRDGKFYDNTFSFAGAFIRNNLTINLEDENCEGHMNGVFLLSGKSHVDNNTSVDHQKPNSYSNELYKGILDEKSTGVFNGKIYVRKDAQKTNAFQSNNNILLSDETTIHTKPQLEIWADDVKCSHGCTSGQLDEDAIFYLRARGIDEKSAKGLLLNAFAGEALHHITLPVLKEEVESKISDLLA